MPHRDDPDAWLHRADALAREAARLQAENDALRDELATRPPAPPRRPRRSRHAAAVPDGDDRAARALAGEVGRAAWGGAGLGALAGLATPLAWLGTGRDALLIAAVLALAALPVGWLLARHLVVRPAITRELAWLASLDGLALAGYLEQLGRAHPDGHQVVVRVRVASPVDGALRRQVAASTVGRGPGAVRWDGDTLVLTSPRLRTAIETEGGCDHDNAPIHAWFRGVAERVLVPLAGRARIDRVEVA